MSADHSVQRFGCFKLILLLWRRFVLVITFPFIHGHTIDRLSGLVVVHIQSSVIGCSQVPFGQAVAAETGQVHQVNILNIAALLQVLDESAKRSRFDFFFCSLVHFLSRQGSWWVLGIGLMERENNNIPPMPMHRLAGKIVASCAVRK